MARSFKKNLILKIAFSISSKCHAFRFNADCAGNGSGTKALICSPAVAVVT